MPRHRAVLPALVAGLLTTAGCAAEPADSGELQVVAAFYPLEFVVDQVGGDHVEVANLTPPGSDPHSVELAPAKVDEMAAADLVVYLSGLQPATDDAVALAPPQRLLDAAGAAELTSAAGEDGGLDPHFWLDPTRLAEVARQVAEELADADETNAEEFRENAQALAAELDALDSEMGESLAPCAGATLVVSHEAFGYLADRYDLRQVGISGINPEAEPSPARLREVAQVVESEGVQTLFFETITSPKVTQTLAEELGVATAVLDPLEGQSDAGADYLDVMRANLDALTDGLVCD